MTAGLFSWLLAWVKMPWYGAREHKAQRAHVSCLPRFRRWRPLIIPDLALHRVVPHPNAMSNDSTRHSHGPPFRNRGMKKLRRAKLV